MLLILLAACGGSEPDLVTTSPGGATGTGTGTAAGGVSVTSEPPTDQGIVNIAAIPLAEAAALTFADDELSIEMQLETTDVLESDQPGVTGTLPSTTTLLLRKNGDRVDIETQSTLIGNGLIWVDDGRTVLQLEGSPVVDYVTGTAITSINDDLQLLHAIVSTSSSKIVEQDAITTTFDLSCGDRADELFGSIYVVLCHPETTTLVTVSAQSGRILHIDHEGPYPLYPGLVVSAKGRISYGQNAKVDADPPFDSSDTGPLECVASQLGLTVDDHGELAETIESNQTRKNGELFLGCGFSLYPPGSDLFE